MYYGAEPAELNFININGIHLNNNNKLLLLTTNIAITGWLLHDGFALRTLHDRRHIFAMMMVLIPFRKK